MKNKLLILTVFLFLFVGSAVATGAQTTDEKIQALQAQIEELKKQKLSELEKARDALNEEIKKIKGGDTSSDSPAPAQTPTVTTVVTKTDLNTDTPVKVAQAMANVSKMLGQSDNTVQSRCSLVRLSPDTFSRYDNLVCDTARDLLQVRREQAAEADDNAGREKALKKGLQIGSFQTPLTAILATKLSQSAEQLFDKSVKSFLLESEAARVDKQMGADSKAAGTTSLAVKGGIPAFLGWAEENGAAEGSITGSTVTFRINPVGLADALDRWGKSNGLIDASKPEGMNTLFHKDEDGVLKFFRNTAFGVSFDITRGTDPPVFIGSKQQLSGLSFRYQFLNRRDPRHSRYAADWELYRTTDLKAFSQRMTDIMKGLVTEMTGAPDQFQNAALQQWLVNTNAALAEVSSPAVGSTIDAEEQIRVVLEREIAKLPLAELSQDPAVVAALNAFTAEHIKLDNKRAELMKKAAKGEVATFEYTYYREQDLSNFRAIVSKGFWDGAELAFNGSLTMFNKKPASTDPAATIKRIRDFDFSLQLDVPFGSFIKRATKNADIINDDLRPSLIGIPVLTFAGKYQRLQSDAVLPDGAVKTGTKGDLAFGQLKLTIPINFNGLSFKLPFSITLANRTDLIKEKDVRGNFGFTLDIDPFFTMLKNSLSGSLFRP
jgi:TolA-binding protein